MMRIRSATPAGSSSLGRIQRKGGTSLRTCCIPQPVVRWRIRARNRARSADARVARVTDHPHVPALMGVGLSHRTAPLVVREQLALAPIQATELLRRLLAPRAVDEAVVLSTCNRTELY